VERFARLIQLIGPEAFGRLQAAEVAVFGLGAVGSYAVEALARAGVGALRLVDFDTVQPSNINRQLLALQSTVGRPKTELAADRVRDISPRCRVDRRDAFVDAATAPALLDPLPDALVDAIDGVNTKVHLLAAAHRLGLFTVSSMGAARRLDPARIRTADLADTEVCPLARIVRRRLHRLGIHRGIRCVFSTEPVPPPAASVVSSEAPLRGRPRQPLGSISYVTGMFGLTAAAVTLEHLMQRPGTRPPAGTSAR